MELETNTPIAAPQTNGHSKPARDHSQPEGHWQVVFLPVASIGPNPFQPRVDFDEADMLDLIASVRAHGVLQPVTVRTAPNGAAPTAVAPNGVATAATAPNGAAPTGAGANHKGAKNAALPHQAALPYQLIAGERRLRACRGAGRKTIPAIVRDDLSDAQAAELALVENVQRANLNAIEEAKGYRRLMLDFRMKEERIAKKVGKSVQTVRDVIRLLALPPEVQLLLSTKKLTASHGQQLLRLAPFERICVLVANAAVKEKLTATSLTQALLPNVRDLRAKKLVVELDYRTKFDWKRECGQCPHKAYVASGYGSYCLLPAQWQRQQDEAIERQKQEATRVLEEAKRGSEGDVDITVLPAGSYRDLSYGQPPAGCSGACACRGESTDPRDPTKKRPVCLDPERFRQLAQAERQAHEEARGRKFLGLWHEARQNLDSQIEAGNAHSCAALALLPLIRGQHLRYGAMEPWRTMSKQVASELGFDWPLDALLDAETPAGQSLSTLENLDINDLLRFVACVLLAQEAREAVHFGGETPLLSSVLGTEMMAQGELPHEEFPDGDIEPPDEEDD